MPAHAPDSRRDPDCYLNETTPFGINSCSAENSAIYKKRCSKFSHR